MEPVLDNQPNTLEYFGKQLGELRLRAGYSSLDAVVRKAEELHGQGTQLVSKSMLSLYERGEIKTPKPETLRLLAELYRTSYEELAQCWFEERYALSGISLDRAAPVQKLRGPTEEAEASMYTLQKFKETQAALPEGSQVAVCAVNFVEHEFFLELVGENLLRGIQYHFLVPAEEHIRYTEFLVRIAARHPSLEEQLNGKLTFFTPRLNLDFPVSFVLFLHPGNELQGFIALPVGNQPFYYQVADLRLSLRLFESFRWSMTVSNDPEIKRRLALLHIDAQDQKMESTGKHFSSFRSKG